MEQEDDANKKGDNSGHIQQNNSTIFLLNEKRKEILVSFNRNKEMLNLYKRKIK